MELEFIKPIRHAIKRGLGKTQSKTNAIIIYINNDYKAKVDGKIYEIENNTLDDCKNGSTIYPSRVNDRYYDENDIDSKYISSHKSTFDYDNYKAKSDYAKKVVNKYWKKYYIYQKILQYKITNDNKLYIVKLSKRFKV